MSSLVHPSEGNIIFQWLKSRMEINLQWIMQYVYHIPCQISPEGQVAKETQKQNQASWFLQSLPKEWLFFSWTWVPPQALPASAWVLTWVRWWTSQSMKTMSPIAQVHTQQQVKGPLLLRLKPRSVLSISCVPFWGQCQVNCVRCCIPSIPHWINVWWIKKKNEWKNTKSCLPKCWWTTLTQLILFLKDRLAKKKKKGKLRSAEKSKSLKVYLLLVLQFEGMLSPGLLPWGSEEY